jgi:hypothetical protein
MVLRGAITLIFICSIIIFSCKENNSEKKVSNTQTQNISGQTQIKSDSFNNQSSQSLIKWEPEYESYLNARFGFSVKYPANLTIQKDSDNGDGRKLNSNDGFTMSVFGSNEISSKGQSLSELYNSEIIQHKDVTYKVKKTNWFVISGYDGENIFYIKKYVGAGSTNTLYLVYPSNLRDKYYDVITIISKSFVQTKTESIN